jgi:hypothetical protein
VRCVGSGAGLFFAQSRRSAFMVSPCRGISPDSASTRHSLVSAHRGHGPGGVDRPVAAGPGIDRLLVTVAARYLLAPLGFTAFSRAGTGRVESRWLRSCKEMRFGEKGVKNFERTASQDRVIDARWSRVFPETNVTVGSTGALAQLRGMLGRNGRGSPGIFIRHLHRGLRGGTKRAGTSAPDHPVRVRR